MQSTWGKLTIGADPVQISSSKTKTCKLSIQSAPGNTGNVKIGGSDVTADNSTAGIYLSPSATTNPDNSNSPGDAWSLESHTDANTLDISQYFIHGTHAGDIVMWEYHVN